MGTGEALHYFRKLHSIFTRSFCPISGLINEVKYRSSPRGVVKFSNQNKSIETVCLTPQQRKSDDADVFGLVKSPVFSSPSLCSKPFLPQKTYFYCQLEQYNVSLFWKEETTDASTSTMEKRFKDLDFFKSKPYEGLNGFVLLQSLKSASSIIYLSTSQLHTGN